MKKICLIPLLALLLAGCQYDVGAYQAARENQLYWESIRPIPRKTHEDYEREAREIQNSDSLRNMNDNIRAIRYGY